MLPENTTAKVRQKKQWILKLRTVLLYGPNDKIGEEHQRDSDIPIGISFPSLTRNKKHSTKSRNQAFSKSNSVKNFLNFYENKLQKDLNSLLYFAIISITSSLNKRKLKELAILLYKFVHDQKENFLYLQLHLSLNRPS